MAKKTPDPVLPCRSALVGSAHSTDLADPVYLHNPHESRSPLNFRTFAREFLIFGLKQAYACVFGGYLLAMILLTQYWYPLEGISRYDFLFLSAVAFQVALLVLRMETWREAGVIVVFHVIATLMELFKTADAIGSWHYPGEYLIGIGNVPLFAGFMYSAVGSYIARVWRIFDFRFSHYPPGSLTVLLAVAIYVNFFTHHFMIDLRWILLAVCVVMFLRCQIYFKIDQVHRHMPLLVGWLLVAHFIWFAENIATYANVWIYPTQREGWQPVSPAMIVSWYLLMLISFVLVSLVNRPRAMTREE